MKKLLIPALLATFSFSAYAQDACKVVVESNDQMKFNTAEITVDKAQCKEFTVTLKHVGSLPKAAMGHNFVVVKEADFNALVADAIKAGAASDYIPADDARVLAKTKLLGGGEEDSVVINTENFSPEESYQFLCTFPGHAAMMKGKFIVK